MNHVSLLRKDGSGNSDPDGPQVFSFSAFPEAGKAPCRKHEREDHPILVDGVAGVKDAPRGDSHRRSSPKGGTASDEAIKPNRQGDRGKAHERERQPQRPNMTAKERLCEKQHIKMERTVVIRGIVMVESRVSHLVDKPSINPLVEMRRFHP